MKIAIGYRLQNGPWGGGNQFARSLARALERRGDTVCFDLVSSDLDIILLTDPRWLSPSVSFGSGAILRYLILRNPSALVVHRINECDERKSTRHMNRRLRWANYVADHTIFIASWLEDLEVWNRHTPSSVILNGADPKIFQQAHNSPWNGQEPLKLVTHHWGGNWMKGFDVYVRLDDMLIMPEWRGRIEFTYIGNLPNGFRFKHARHLAPLQGDKLARELAQHHVYITASLNEPAGMHHIEGALCGLPLLYRRSGALPEYCRGYGIEFEGEDFVPSLLALIKNYSALKQVMPTYPHTDEKMCADYLDIFDSMIADSTSILAARRLWRSPSLVLRSLMFM